MPKPTTTHDYDLARLKAAQNMANLIWCYMYRPEWLVIWEAAQAGRARV